MIGEVGTSFKNYRNIKKLLDYLGMLEHSLDINHPFTAQTLFEGITRVTNNSDSVRTHLLERSASLRKELMAYFNDLRKKVMAR